MRKRKAILLVDDKEETKIARDILSADDIDFIEYHINEFQGSCCGELPTTKAPAIFGPTGVFRGIEGVKKFVMLQKNLKVDDQELFW